MEAQTLIEVSDSLTNNPIENILIKGTSKFLYTNANGLFDLEIFDHSDSLTFQHLNYLQKRVSVNDIALTKKILLKPKTFLEKEILISDKNSMFENKEVVFLSEESKLSQLGIAEMIESNSTINLKDYGGRGALKTISSRGLSSENTIILFNEAKVNDISTGGFDFSKLSSVSVDKVEYLKSNSEDELSAGGLIKLFSGNFDNSNSKSLGIRFGSENYQSYFSTINQTVNKFSFQLRGERSYSPNNFEYNFEKKKLTRENAFFNKSFASVNANYISQETVIRFYFHYSYLLNGIPGYVVTNNYNSSRAVNKNRAFLPIINFTHLINSNFFIQSTIHSHFQNLVLSDDHKNIVVNNDTKDSDLYDGSFNLRLDWRDDNFSSSIKYQYEYGELKNQYFSANQKTSNDFSKRNVNTISVFSTYRLMPLLNLVETAIVSLNASLSEVKEHIAAKEENIFFNFSTSIGISPSFLKDASIGVTFKKNNRIPTFNERYYSNLFDVTKLKNEKYTSLDFGFKYSVQNYESGINIYKIWGLDRIIWVPTRLALQTPKNIGRVESSGIEVFTKSSILKKLIELNLIYTYTEALNKSETQNSNSYNKQIVYIPKHKIRTSLSIFYKNITSKTDFSFSSESFFTSDNNPINRLDSYFVIDQTFLYDLKISDYNAIIALSFYNILAEEYLIVQSYPMPLQSFNFSLLLKFN